MMSAPQPQDVPTYQPSSPRKRGSSIPKRRSPAREAAAYWVARSSRAMTVGLPSQLGFQPSSSPLPRRDDLDLVAGFKRGVGPAAARQHVEIQRDREMLARIVEFAEQRVDAGR